MSAISKIASQAVRVIDRNSPAILTGLGVAGLATTAVLTAKATFKAAETLHNYENKDNGLYIRASNKERVEILWRFYIPAVGTGVLATACIIGSQTLNNARQAALVSGLTIATESFREYRDKNLELFGEKNDEKVRDEVAKERIAAHPPTSAELAMIDIHKELCKDMYSGRYFQATKEDIRAAMNDLNEQMINGDNMANLNEFYGRLGLPPIPAGEQVGWSVEHLLDINFTSVLTEQGVPCLAMEFRALPTQDYYRFH